MEQWPASAYSVVLDARLGKQPSLLPSQDDLLTSLQNKGHSVLKKGQPRGEEAPKHLRWCQESGENMLS